MKSKTNNPKLFNYSEPKMAHLNCSTIVLRVDICQEPTDITVSDNTEIRSNPRADKQIHTK